MLFVFYVSFQAVQLYLFDTLLNLIPVRNPRHSHRRRPHPRPHPRPQVRIVLVYIQKLRRINQPRERISLGVDLLAILINTIVNFGNIPMTKHNLVRVNHVHVMTDMLLKFNGLKKKTPI